MTDNDARPLDDLEQDARDAAARTRKAVKDGADAFGDAIDDLRTDPDVTNAARSVVRRADRFRTEQPAVFAAIIAATSFVAGVAIARVLR